MLNIIKHKISNFDYQDFFKSLLWAIVIAIIFRTFLFEPFRIPSGSMIPTLQVGDYLFTSKYSYGFSKYSFPFGLGPFEGRIFANMPKRGDIIVFKGVNDPQTFYIKRLVGLPGDEIQVRQGKLYINKEIVKQNEVGKYEHYGIYGQKSIFTEFKEKIDESHDYSVLQSSSVKASDFPNETRIYKVPADHFFFMGDNRNNSIDSRFLNEMGYIPFDRLVGRADFLLWTTDFSIIDLIKSGKTNRAFTLIR